MHLSQLVELAESQHGVFSTAQATDRGVDRRRLSDMAAGGILQRVHKGVYRVRGGEAGPHTALMAACLAGGERTFASHRSAAHLWGLAGSTDQPPPPEVISPKWRTLRDLEIIAHESIILADRDTTERNGIPVVTPLRCVFLLGAVSHPSVVAQAIDQGTKDRMFTIGDIHGDLLRLGKSGRDGIGPVRDALGLRHYSSGESDSVLEQRFLALVRNHGFPPPVRQFPVLTPSGGFRIDFAYPQQKVAIELDGVRWHSDPEAFQRDRRRQNALVLAGWTVLRFTWDDVVGRPNSVVSTLHLRLRS